MMPLKILSLSQKTRRGVTILEVLFAIGIVVVGLLGVAAIIPLANRNAIESYVLTNAAVMGENAYRESLVRKYYSPSATHPMLEFANSRPSTSDVSQIERLSSNFVGVCIDPIFWAAQPEPGTYSNGANEGAYARNLFPYFATNYDPLTAPNEALGSSPSVPRMQRVTFPEPGTTTPLQYKVALRRFSNIDDLVNPRDPTAPSKSIRGFYSPPGNPNNILQEASRNDFTWMLTISPNEQMQDIDQPFYSLAVVVFHRRNLSCPAPSLDGAPVNGANLPADERVCLAESNMSAMPRNSGTFAIRIRANDAVDSSLKANDWLMLSRETTSGVTKHIHHWYRVVSTSDPQLVSPTWERTVQVSGPSWDFSSGVTHATLMKNVASVYERIIEMPRVP